MLTALATRRYPVLQRQPRAHDREPGRCHALLTSERDAHMPQRSKRTEAAATNSTQPAQSKQPTTSDEQPQQPRRRHGPRPGTENARRGGMAVRDKYGPDFYAAIGKKGGSVVRQKHGAEFYAAIGKKGGEATRNAHGGQHYSRIGRMGGLRLRQRADKDEQTPENTRTPR